LTPLPLSTRRRSDLRPTPCIYLGMTTTKQLGNSDMKLTSIGLGAWAIGGAGYAFGWGEQDDKDSIAAIHKALELGLNWIDTAAIYGLGHSEEVVGRALKSWTGSKPYVFTKCSMRWNDEAEISHNLSAEGVRWECEQSLKRLDVETIDLYQIHWPNPDEQVEEGWGEIQKLKAEGKIRWAGVSNFSVDQMKRAAAIAPITSLQPPYSILRPAIEKEILPYCAQQGIGVINYSPMVSGLLTGKMTKDRLAHMADNDWRKKSANFNEPKLSKNLALADLLGEIGSQHGVETGVVAIAWTLRRPEITAAIVGGRTPEQLEGTAKALSFRLTDDEVKRIDGFVTENEIA
jgi:aryl-alcohol dehydrogenase-like predicted oxidoreductase